MARSRKKCRDLNVCTYGCDDDMADFMMKLKDEPARMEVDPTLTGKHVRTADGIDGVVLGPARSSREDLTQYCIRSDADGALLFLGNKQFCIIE